MDISLEELVDLDNKNNKCNHTVDYWIQKCGNRRKAYSKLYMRNIPDESDDSIDWDADIWDESLNVFY